MRQLSSAEGSDRGTVSRLLGRLTRAVVSSARRAGVASLGRGRWLADTLVEAAPRLPVRDLETLRRHHHGLFGDALADALVQNAVRTTTAVGAAGGALATVDLAAPPLLFSVPAQIAAETLAVAAVEVKLIAELHEAYGVQVPGTGTQRAMAFVQAWARQRGVDPAKPGTVTLALGTAARRDLRRRLMGRAGRNITSLAPFLTGAFAGAALNHRATRRLADAVRADLRRRVDVS